MLDQDALDHPLKALTNYSPCLFAIDTLHCVDLGVAAHVYANVFHELTQSGQTPRRPASADSTKSCGRTALQSGRPRRRSCDTKTSRHGPVSTRSCAT